MANTPQPSTRVVQALEEARDARDAGRVAEALSRLEAARTLVTQGPVRRQLRVQLHVEEGLCHILADEPQQARTALTLALELAQSDAALADPIRAHLTTLALMMSEPRRASRQLVSRRRERRASLIAEARLHIWLGETDLAEQRLQACEKAPGGTSELTPPSTALRSLVALWEGRPEQARLLHEGVSSSNNPYWDLVWLLTLRALWVDSGDARYLQLALGLAEQLRFTPKAGNDLPGLRAAVAAQHGLLLTLSGQIAMGVSAAEEALRLLGRMTVPEWPLPAILHDCAVVFRDGSETAAWQRCVDMWHDTATADWAQRMELVTGPRAKDALNLNGESSGARSHAAPSVLTEVSLRLIEGWKDPKQALVRALSEELGVAGVRWNDSQGRQLAATGTALAQGLREDDVTMPLESGASLVFFGAREGLVRRLDAKVMDRLRDATVQLQANRRQERELRDALEVSEASRKQALDSLERTRRGAIAGVLGGRFPSVSGRSNGIRSALDRLALLAQTSIPVLLDGQPGTGRRHLGRAFATHLGTAPERCPIVDLSLVPPRQIIETMQRIEREASSGSYILAGVNALSPEAASWLIERGAASDRSAHMILTIDENDTGDLAQALRSAFSPGRVRVPGLDERLEDLPMLIDAIARTLGRRPEHIGSAARAVLARRSWAGHVAELRTLLASSVVRAGQRKIVPEDLEAAAEEVATASLSEGLDLGYHDAVKSYRQRLLRHALETTGGNRTQAARLLGVQRTYFMRLIRDLGADDIPPSA